MLLLQTEVLRNSRWYLDGFGGGQTRSGVGPPIEKRRGLGVNAKIEAMRMLRYGATTRSVGEEGRRRRTSLERREEGGRAGGKKSLGTGKGQDASEGRRRRQQHAWGERVKKEGRSRTDRVVVPGVFVEDVDKSGPPGRVLRRARPLRTGNWIELSLTPKATTREVPIQVPNYETAVPQAGRKPALPVLDVSTG